MNTVLYILSILIVGGWAGGAPAPTPASPSCPSADWPSYLLCSNGTHWLLDAPALLTLDQFPPNPQQLPILVQPGQHLVLGRPATVNETLVLTSDLLLAPSARLTLYSQLYVTNGSAIQVGAGAQVALDEAATIHFAEQPNPCFTVEEAELLILLANTSEPQLAHAFFTWPNGSDWCHEAARDGWFSNVSAVGRDAYTLQSSTSSGSFTDLFNVETCTEASSALVFVLNMVCAPPPPVDTTSSSTVVVSAILLDSSTPAPPPSPTVLDVVLSLFTSTTSTIQSSAAPIQSSSTPSTNSPSFIIQSSSSLPVSPSGEPQALVSDPDALSLVEYLLIGGAALILLLAMIASVVLLVPRLRRCVMPYRDRVKRLPAAPTLPERPPPADGGFLTPRSLIAYEAGESHS